MQAAFEGHPWEQDPSMEYETDRWIVTVVATPETLTQVFEPKPLPYVAPLPLGW